MRPYKRKSRIELDNFEALGLSEEILQALKEKGFESPTPIQRETIPALLGGEKNLIAQAQTGTGKTAAFGLPLLEKIEPGKGKVQALILAPTRELAVQVAEEMNSLKGNKRLSIVPIYGGQSYEQQLRRLKRGVDILVGTPGRIIDHLNKGHLKLEGLQYLVLDEADEMLNMGFLEDVETVLEYCPEQRQLLLFSATMPRKIMELATKYMPDHKKIAIKKQQLTTNLTDQIYFEIRDRDKLELLCRIIDMEKEFYGVIFCRTKRDTDELSKQLANRGYAADGLHGDITQGQRERTLQKFKQKQLYILVATDVAARGIDIDNLTHVVNYSLPQDPESYVHRIGRTGRAGRKGTAITFVSPQEYKQLHFIQRITSTKLRKEDIPSVEAVIKSKRDNILNELSGLMENDPGEEFVNLGQKLLSEYDSENLVVALLKKAFERELEEGQYKQINKPNSSDWDSDGQCRLFIAMGRKDGMTKPKLVDFIYQETKVAGRLIDDVRVMEEFSFISVPFPEAEVILHAFKKRDGRKSLVSKAKSDKKRGGGGGRSSGGARRGGFRGRGGNRERADRGGRRSRR